MKVVDLILSNLGLPIIKLVLFLLLLRPLAAVALLEKLKPLPLLFLLRVYLSLVASALTLEISKHLLLINLFLQRSLLFFPLQTLMGPSSDSVLQLKLVVSLEAVVEVLFLLLPFVLLAQVALKVTHLQRRDLSLLLAVILEVGHY